MKSRSIDLLVIAFTLLLLSAVIVNALPGGPDSITGGKSERRRENNTGVAVPALAGNVTALDIVGSSITKFWQGYFGNISGTVQLSDANNNSLYNWAAASPSGEIYASRNQQISWNNNIGCANSSTRNSENTFLGSDSTNISDNLNLTFDRPDHPNFFVGSMLMVGCNSTSVNAAGTGAIFWESLLQENTTGTMVYASQIQQDTAGFDGGVHDFQMLVGEPGSGAQTFPAGTTTTYYFFVELG